MWGILERNQKEEEEKKKQQQHKKRKKNWNSRDLQCRATFCPAQSRDDVRRGGPDAGRQTELRLVTESRREETRGHVFPPLEHGGRLPAVLSPPLGLHSRLFLLIPTILNTPLCSGECALCMSTSRLAGRFLQFITCLQQPAGKRPSELAPDAMQGDLKSFWYVFFFFLVSKNPKSTAASSIVPYIEYSVIN